MAGASIEKNIAYTEPDFGNGAPQNAIVHHGIFTNLGILQLSIGDIHRPFSVFFFANGKK